MIIIISPEVLIMNDALISHLVSDAVWEQRPDHHAGRLPSNDAEAQTGSIVDQLDLLHVTPTILQRTEDGKHKIHQQPGEEAQQAER